PACTPSLLTFPFFDKRYLELQAYRVINKRGDVNLQAWGGMKNALLRPHQEAQRNQARSEQRQEEKEVKNCRLEEALPEMFQEDEDKSKGKAKAQSNAATPSVPEEVSDVDAVGEEDDLMRNNRGV
ncbi:hypothetical protein H0H87_011265, partial [Tephrocybe sp. NHM501043]